MTFMMVPKTPLFQKLCNQEPEEWFAPHWPKCEPWLDALYDGRTEEAAVLCDYLSDHDLRQGETIRKMIRPEMVRHMFRRVIRDRMQYQRSATSVSALNLAKARLGRRVLNRFFSFYLNTRASDAVNDFTRRKMQEDGLSRKIMPPEPVPDTPAGDGPVVVRDA